MKPNKARQHSKPLMMRVTVFNGGSDEVHSERIVDWNKNGVQKWYVKLMSWVLLNHKAIEVESVEDEGP